MTVGCIENRGTLPFWFQLWVLQGMNDWLIAWVTHLQGTCILSCSSAQRDACLMVGFQALWASLKEPWLFKLTGRHKDREVFTSQIILTVGRCFLSFSQQGNAFQGPRKADIVAREKVTQLIQFQAERILALKEEITLLRKKGGLILPPIQTPQENRWNPWAF